MESLVCCADAIVGKQARMASTTRAHLVLFFTVVYIIHE